MKIEYHLGGNHLLENLITDLGSLQFKGSLPDLIFSECMSELEDQLQKQNFLMVDMKKEVVVII